MNRKALAPAKRFAVWKRDGFRCTFCGVAATEETVTLEVARVVATADGGGDDFENLTTACKPCSRNRKPRRNDARQQALALRFDGATFAEIGAALGVTRQRVQQWISPPKIVKAAILARANGACETCGVDARGPAAHIHHRVSRGIAPESYNAEPNLTLLCIPCHRAAHADPILVDRWRPRTPEERRASAALGGMRRGALRLGISPEEYEARRLQGERWCSWHRAWEPASEFVRSTASPDGLGYICNQGNREQVRQRQGTEYNRRYVERNREKVAAYHREYNRRRRALKSVAS